MDNGGKEDRHGGERDVGKEEHKGGNPVSGVTKSFPNLLPPQSPALILAKHCTHILVVIADNKQSSPGNLALAAVQEICFCRRVGHKVISTGPGN